MSPLRLANPLRGRTVRSRIALVYGVVFVALGVVLLGLVNVLSRAGTHVAAENALGPSIGPSPTSSDPRTPHPTGKPVIELPAIGGSNRKMIVTVVSDVASQQVLIWSAVALLITGVLAVAVGWWTAGRVLRPIHAMTAKARRISQRNMHERIAMDGPQDELKELADTFDALLSRLDAAFDSQRRFIANASHELRTPLAGQRAAIQIGLEDNPGPEELARVKEGLLEANRRSERLIDGLLMLAHGERGIERYETFDLGHVVEEEIAAVQPTAREHGVRITADGDSYSVRGDRVLIGRLVANLLRNAVLYNHQDGVVRVHTSPTGRLTVSNTGPVIQQAEVESLFEPFRRGPGRDRRCGRGEGLGLSIVRAVAQAHEGTVTATPNPGGGLTMTLELPAESSDEGGSGEPQRH
ncbi:ATP-binding protein [Streptomyces sp. H27-C3]|uniref:sensor histidine kinase n=1 Tax=Streptomyces sp. H27-C3 TaxID=3046305 RepID=UPI0024BBBCD0|nr:ATP-binding protein [Streptomyces sp. H27-C3]MDJ0466891.1 ATP-binding protein [Streptomyces sp. H27-C3]